MICRLLGVLAVSALVSSCGGHALVRDRIAAHMLHPASMICPDNLPVMIFIAEDCPLGICGYTCEPGRWHDRQ